MNKLLTFAGIGTALLAYQHIANKFFNLPAEQEPQIEIPIQEIIKETFLRISTKENMAIVAELLKLDCIEAEKILEPYQYTLKTGGKKVRLVMAVLMSEMFINKSPNDKIPK